MNESFSSGGCERGSDFGDVTEVEERGFDDMADVGLKGEGGIKDHTKVSGLGRWGDNGVVNGESGVIGFAECGFGANEKKFCFVTVKFEKVVLHPDFNS